MKKNYKKVIKTVVFVLIYYYIILPPLNLSSPLFWFSLFLTLLFYAFVSSIGNLSKLGSFNEKGEFIRNVDYEADKTTKYILKFIGITAGILIIINIINMPLFNSKAYATRITIDEDGIFTEDVKPVDFDKLALLDKESSRKLGDRVMGRLPELVSQYDVSSLYTQINYKETIERVTPLEYDSPIKYFTNRKNGIAGFIKVNSVTGQANLERLEKGIKYANTALFNENLHRKLRFSYPRDIFGPFRFEVDDNNKPFWTIPVIKYKGIGLRKDVSHLIIFDPVTGKSNKYKVADVPSWVDHVYDPHLIIEQVDDWGKYKQGFINTIIGQKGVVATTEGYNYIVMNDDVYLTTGMTSAARDESNIGFILTNLRTKETKFYAAAGAEEYSAMESAKGQVQQMNYTSTFPILINLNNKPTYLISLKDKAGLVKMYAFIDLEDYQKVTVTDSSLGIEEAAKRYLGTTVDATKDQKDKSIQIKEIKNIVIDGTTVFFIIDSNNNKYRAQIKVNPDVLPFIKAKDNIEVIYIEDQINEIIKIK